MEMHQIRYFLAVARNLNFTRAAEECHVSQPSLTRAIKLLEDEFGGELFRRERNLSHLTELGQRMQPLMQRCYDTAQGAKALATSLKRGEVATLRLALTRTIDIALLAPHLADLVRALEGLEIRFMRGTAPEVAELMKHGNADVAVSGPLAVNWERFDVWPLFQQRFALFVGAGHRLAGEASVGLEFLAQERLLVRTYCELADKVAAALRDHGVDGRRHHEIASEHDLVKLIEQGFGVAIAPASLAVPKSVKRIDLPGLEPAPAVYLLTVAGRQRTPATATLIKQLRAADWSALAA